MFVYYHFQIEEILPKNLKCIAVLLRYYAIYFFKSTYHIIVRLLSACRIGLPQFVLLLQKF